MAAYSTGCTRFHGDDGLDRSSDETITQIAVDEGRIVVTKDSDFVDSFLLMGRPPYLLLISTGNVGN